MANKKLIIWDFDGPIVDSRKLALEFTQHQYHNVSENLHRNLFNRNIFTELAKLKKKDISEAEVDLFLESSYWPRKLELPPVEGIKVVLEALQADFQLVINSSSLTPQIHNYLEKNKLRSLFQKIYGNEIKSKEEKFKLILEDFADIFHIPSIVVLWGYQLKAHFASIADRVVFVKRPSELLTAIKTHFSVLKPATII